MKVSEQSRSRAWIIGVVAFVVGAVAGQAAGSRASMDIERRLASKATAVESAEAALSASETELATAYDELAVAEEGLQDLELQGDDLRATISSLETKLLKLQAKRPLPNVAGISLLELEELADRYGWEVAYSRQASNLKPGTVLSQSPAAGTEMRLGAPIKVTVAKKPPPPPKAAPEREPVKEEVEVEEEETADVGSDCTSGYSPCLPPASDYDCAGGTGDGPKYTGQVQVTGSDPYDLDSDSDGVGCEP